MEQRNFDYSLKNVPIASNFSYMKAMMKQYESWVKRAHWKVFHYVNKFPSSRTKPTYGFKTSTQIKKCGKIVFVVCNQLL